MAEEVLDEELSLLTGARLHGCLLSDSNKTDMTDMRGSI